MIEQILENFGIDGVQGFSNKLKTTNNFIGSQSNSYSSQSIETKRITITPTSYDDWVGITFFLAGRSLGLNDSEIKVLVGLCELSNVDREFTNTIKVHDYIAHRIGICTFCVRNQIYFLKKRGFVKRKRGGIWVISESIWWMLKNTKTNRRLIISVEYETETANHV